MRLEDVFASVRAKQAANQYLYTTDLETGMFIDTPFGKGVINGVTPAIHTLVLTTTPRRTLKLYKIQLILEDRVVTLTCTATTQWMLTG
jgi:hypothetical protein